MKTFAHIIIATLLALMTATACTIKERRLDCPCWLEVEFPVLDTVKTAEVLVTLTVDEQYWYRDTAVFNDDYARYGYREYRPRRGIIRFSSILGADYVPESGSVEYVEPVNAWNEIDYPHIFADGTYLETFNETVRYRTEQRKQYCVLAVRVNNTYNPERGNLKVKVKGQAIGLNIYSLEPVAGDFVKTQPVSDDGRAVIVLPRQLQDDDLTLSLYRESEELIRIRITDELTASGYDWTKPNLDDVEYTIDKVTPNENVVVIDWESGEFYRHEF